MSKIAVIDYDAGNTLSVIKALEYLGESVELSRSPEVLRGCGKVILPGVGAFFDAMTRLREYGLVDIIRRLVDNDIPFLGICLGMQLLFDQSEETIGADAANGSIEGLHLLKGGVKRFAPVKDLKIPHMGWNSINIENTSSRLFKGLPENPFVYFVHSYYLEAANRSDVAATCDYGVRFDCAVERGNLFGCQFHPEKSGDIGLEILKNFCRL